MDARRKQKKFSGFQQDLFRLHLKRELPAGERDQKQVGAVAFFEGERRAPAALLRGMGVDRPAPVPPAFPVQKGVQLQLTVLAGHVANVSANRHFSIFFQLFSHIIYHEKLLCQILFCGIIFTAKQGGIYALKH